MFDLRYTTGDGRTFSIIDAPSVGHWSVVADGQLDRSFGPDTNVAPATCGPTTATWHGFEFTRAPADMASAVGAAWTGEATQGDSY
jgi:hypothetical protein